MKTKTIINIISVWIVFLFALLIAELIIFLKKETSIEFALMIGVILYELMDKFYNIRDTILYHTPLMKFLMKLLDDNKTDAVEIIIEGGPKSIQELASKLKKSQIETFGIIEELVLIGILETEEAIEEEKFITKYKIK